MVWYVLIIPCSAWTTSYSAANVDEACLPAVPPYPLPCCPTVPNPTPGGRDHFVFLTGDRGACHLDRKLQVAGEGGEGA